MDKVKQERLKTMFLFLLMFFGINYALYTFYLQPKALEIEDIKATYQQSNETISLQAAKEEEKSLLEKEIEQLKSVDNQYNNLLIEGLDTIQMAYDFYQFSLKQKIEAVFVRYELGDLMSEEDSMEATSNNAVTTDPTDSTNVDASTSSMEVPMMTVDTATIVIDEKPYSVGKIHLELKMNKEQLAYFFKNIDSISSQKIIIDSVAIKVESKEVIESEIGTSEEAQSIIEDDIVDTTEEIAEETTESQKTADEVTDEEANDEDLAEEEVSKEEAVGLEIELEETPVTEEKSILQSSVNDELEEDKNDIVTVNISFIAYIKKGGTIKGEKGEYSFIQGISNYQDLSKLFSSQNVN